MQEIKFRAWQAHKHRFLDFDWMIRPNGRVYSIVKDEIWDDFTNEVELTQYTGLKDVNGKPIYEGDVVNDGDSGKNFIIYYNQSLATFDLSDVRNTGWLWPFYSTNTAGPYKVIGNKFKNSELLEVTK